MATLETQAMQKCHVVLVTATRNSCTSITGDLFGESLISESLKMGLPSGDQEKAEKLVDSVRTQVASTPEKIDDFIKVLRRNGGEDAAKKLEEQILLLYKGRQLGCYYLYNHALSTMHVFAMELTEIAYSGREAWVQTGFPPRIISKDQINGTTLKLCRFNLELNKSPLSPPWSTFQPPSIAF